MEIRFKVKFAYMGSVLPTVIKHNNEVPQKRFEELFIHEFVENLQDEALRENPESDITVGWKFNFDEGFFVVSFTFGDEEKFKAFINKNYRPDIISNYMQYIYKEYEGIELEKDATTIYFNFEDYIIMVYFNTFDDFQKDNAYKVKENLKSLI